MGEVIYVNFQKKFDLNMPEFNTPEAYLEWIEEILYEDDLMEILNYIHSGGQNVFYDCLDDDMKSIADKYFELIERKEL